jgi:AraC-like DNA-binding protein
MRVRPPTPALRPFVRIIWATERFDPAPPTCLERVLPTAAMHLVVRTTGDPVRVLEPDEDGSGRALPPALVGGARAAPYLRRPAPGEAVGAMLEPGAAQLLFRATADELAGRHTGLADLWGDAATAEAHERLAAAESADERLAVLEALLGARLPPVGALLPAVAGALERFRRCADVTPAANASGYSHRHFVALFREAAGLPPKLYARVLRFQRALARIASADAPPLGHIALAAGYADQAHLTREFVLLSGVTPGRLRRLDPARPNHVPLPPPEVRSVQDRPVPRPYAARRGGES